MLRKENINTGEGDMKNEITIFNNPTPRCPVVLVLDRSYSMNQIIANAGAETGNTYFADGQIWTEVIDGTTRMDELNSGLNVFFREILDDEIAKYSVELKIISFGSSVKHESGFISFSDIDKYNSTALIPDGDTALGAALQQGLESLEARKVFYKNNGIPYYQPWMVLMTDGRPTDEWEAPSNRAKELAAASKLNFFGVGIGYGYDHQCLAEIVPKNRPPAALQETKFREFFKWLSESLNLVSRSQTGERIALPTTENWEQIIL